MEINTLYLFQSDPNAMKWFEGYRGSNQIQWTLQTRQGGPDLVSMVAVATQPDFSDDLGRFEFLIHDTSLAARLGWKPNTSYGYFPASVARAVCKKLGVSPPVDYAHEARLLSEAKLQGLPRSPAYSVVGTITLSELPRSLDPNSNDPHLIPLDVQLIKGLREFGWMDSKGKALVPLSRVDTVEATERGYLLTRTYSRR